MAGSIFFSDNLVWSSNSLGFIHIMDRAIKKCGKDDASLIRAFSDAEGLRSLDINLHENGTLQKALTERLLDAARDVLNDLCENTTAKPDEVKSVEELVATAQLFLAELEA